MLARLGRALALVASMGIAAVGGWSEARAQEVKQVKLTEDQVTRFIEAQKDLAGVADKLQSAGDSPDEALKTSLDDIAKKHQFASFAELDEVAANISMVMAGLDPETGNFNDPLESLKKELEEIKADASIPEAEKTQLVQELEEAIRTTPPLEHKENIDLVKKRREEIEKALQ